MNKKPDETKNGLEVEYREPDNVPTFHVNHAYGGRTTPGDMYANLYSERGSAPDRIVFDENGIPIEEEKTEKKIRELQARIFMDVSSAFSIGTWMISKVLPEEIDNQDVEEALINAFDLEETGHVEKPKKK